MATIKILGGGISGLTAALCLKKAGVDVEVYEKKGYCGKHTNDFQFLENWTFNENVLDFLKRISIRTDFYYKPWYSVEFISHSGKKYLGKSKKPLMYLAKRGRAENTIDKSLEKQAKDNRVRIFYNSTLKPHLADIIATGPQKPLAKTIGINFKLKYPDKAVVLLDNNLSSRLYSYFIVNDGVGEITCCNPPDIKNIAARLNSVIKRFEKLLDIKIGSIEEKFSNTVYFQFPPTTKENNQYLVGEAAGFQDGLAGFGMVYAFKSGYLAAKSIAENLNYEKLWKKDFSKPLKISSKNRVLYNRLSNIHFEKLLQILNSKNFVLRKLRGGDDLQDIMRQLYNNSISSILQLWFFR